MTILKVGSVQDLSGQTISFPTGTVMFFASSTPPSGFLKCNGAAVSRTTYSALFSVIGTTYGAGDGTTTFNLPDLRGQFLRGWDDGSGQDAGRVFGSSQADAMQGHKHQTARSVLMRAGVDGTFDANSNIANANDANSYDFASQMNVAPVTDGTNGTPRTAAETRPKNVALLTCIKF